MKRSIRYILIFVMALSVGALTPVYGDMQDDLDAIRREISQSQAQLKEGKQKEKKLGSQINELETKIQTAEKEINAIQTDINKIHETINAVKESLRVVEMEMEQQSDDLNLRLRSMYKNGEMGMVDVILGSTSVTDFMSNMDMIKLIYESDAQALESIEEHYKEVDARKKELETLQQQLIARQTVQAGKQSELLEDKNAVAVAKSELSQENKNLEKEVDEQIAEANRLAAEIRAMSGDTLYTGNGKLGWPVSGYYRVSSEFGNRIHPILGYAKLHTGMDIPAPVGTPVAAAESGTVIKAGWNNSYGNVVMIDHGKTDGGNLVTLYAHNSKLAVSEGASVSRGQTIAYAGSTGSSTGSHCHLEVRVNGEYQNPRNWL